MLAAEPEKVPAPEPRNVLLTPVVIAAPALSPRSVLFCPEVIFSPALCPIAVFARKAPEADTKALYPTAVCPAPLSFDFKASYPTATLFVPVVIALRAVLPTAVLDSRLLLPLPTLTLLINASELVTANLYPEAGVVDPTITFVPSSKIGAPVLPIVVAPVNLTT